jgi:hypothetical protein
MCKFRLMYQSAAQERVVCCVPCSYVSSVMLALPRRKCVRSVRDVRV